MRLRVLIVGGPQEPRSKLGEFFAGKGADVRDVASEQAIELLRSGPVDLVVAMEACGGEDGGRLLAEMRNLQEAVAVVAVVGTPENGSEALAQGAYDFFLEPIDFARMETVFHNIAEAAELRERGAILGQLNDAPIRLCDQVTQDPRMINLFATVRHLARSEAPVLIEGEPGTGRESLARALHELSRPPGAFVAVTGRSLSVEGLNRAYAKARGGTLFVDDVTAIDPEIAATLVTLLDRRATRTDAADAVRVVASAGEGAIKPVRQGTVRDDLYARFASARLVIPPLRARPADVSVIAREILGRSTASDEVPTLSRETEAALLAHDWQANVAELRNVLESATASAQGPSISPDDLPQPLRSLAPLPADRAEGGNRSLRDVEVELLRGALRETGGNKARAARILGVSRWALQRRLQKHGIDVQELLAGDRQESER